MASTGALRRVSMGGLLFACLPLALLPAAFTSLSLGRGQLNALWPRSLLAPRRESLRRMELWRKRRAEQVDVEASAGKLQQTPRLSEQFLGFALLTFRVIVLINLSNLTQVVHRSVTRMTLLQAALGMMVLIYQIPASVSRLEESALRWLLEKTLLRGCPEWYVPYARQQMTKALWRSGAALQTLVGIQLLARSVPTTLKLSSRLLPPVLLFLDENRDGKVTGLEIEKQFCGITTKICSAFLHWVVGRLFIRLKDPSHKDVDYAEFSEPTQNASGIWAPLLRFLAMKNKESGEESLVHLVDRVLSVVIYAVWIASCLNVFGWKLRTVMTVGGVAGLAIGLAAKTLAQNLISGILLYTNKSIQPGLEMELMSRNLAGIVDNVGWFNTEISLRDGVLVRVPNAELFEGIVAYRSHKRVRVVDEQFVVQLFDHTKLRQLVQEVQKFLRNNPNVLHEKEISLLKSRYKGHIYVYPPQCVFSGLTDQGAKLRIRVYFSGSLSGDAFLHEQSKLLLAVNEIITSFGASVGIRMPAQAIKPKDPEDEESAKVTEGPEGAADKDSQDEVLLSSAAMQRQQSPPTPVPAAPAAPATPAAPVPSSSESATAPPSG